MENTSLQLDSSKFRNILLIIAFVLLAGAFLIISQGINNGKKTTSSRAAPVSVSDKNTFMRQSLYSFDGKTGWYRDCRIDSTAGIDFNNCTTWQPPVDLSAIRGVGNESYSEYGAFTYIKNGQLTLRQVQLSYDGKKKFSRDCPVDQEKGLTFTGCTGWNEEDISNLRGKGNESYGAFTSFIFRKNNQNILREALYSLDGKVGVNRDCVQGTDGLSFSQCAAWSADIDITNLRGTKASTGSDETYGGFSANIYLIAGRQYLRQTILTLDGQKAYIRTCPVNDMTGIDFASCTSWEDINIASMRGVGNETYGGYEEFTYSLDNRPNIIVLMVDDLDVNLMKTLVNAGKLPNFKNYLLSQGTDFDNSFVTNSVCCPSRATFLTGQYSHNNGTYNNEAATHGSVTYLKDNSTIATWLQSSGYVTSLIGKYLNGYGAKGQLPVNLPVSPDGQNLKAEYETYVPPGWSNWQGMIDYSTYKMYGYKFNNNGVVENKYGDESNVANYQTDVISQKSQDFIKSTVQPFFLYITPLAPHVEVSEKTVLSSTYSDAFRLTVRPAPRHLNADVPPLSSQASFNEQDVNDKPAWLRLHPQMSAEDIANNNSLYINRSRSMLAVDDMIGNIAERLKDTGKLENTVFIFTSDNGFLHGEHRLSNKMYAFEEAIRVPLTIRGPGFGQNQVNHKIVLNNDLSATIAEIAGVKPSHTVDGRSIMPIVANPNASWRNKFFIEHWQETLTANNTLKVYDLPTYVAVRTLSTRGVENKAYVEYLTNEKELYDLNSDQPEMNSKHSDPTEQSDMSVLASWIAGFRSCKGSSCWTIEDTNGSTVAPTNSNSLNRAKASIKSPPKVTFTNIRSGIQYVTNTTIRVEASATGTNKISKVEFYDGSTKLGEDTTAPYQYSIRLSTAKTYRFIAKATDTTGTTGQTSVANVIAVVPTKLPTKVVAKVTVKPTVKVFRPVTPTTKPKITVCNALPAPTNLSMTYSPTATQPNRYIFSWNTVSGASYYSIRINNLSNDWSATNTMNLGDSVADSKTNQFVANLTPGQGYGWWVHSRAACGSWSNAAISVGPSPKTITASCSKDAQGRAIGKITWTPTSSLQYALRVDNQADSWNGQCSSRGGDFCSTQQTTSRLFSAQAGAQYGIWIHSISGNTYSNPPTFISLNCKGN